MKKLLFAIFALGLLAVSQPANAQKGYEFFNIGLKAGVNVNSLSDFDNFDDVCKTGFTGGLYLELRPVKFFGVSVEALYNGKYLNGIVSSDTESLSVEAQMHNVDFPILAKIYLWKWLSIGAGITPSLTIDKSISGSNQDAFEVNTADFSIPFNLGIMFKCGLTLDARYQIGLTDVTTFSELGQVSASTIKESKATSFTFMIGWSF